MIQLRIKDQNLRMKIKNKFPLLKALEQQIASSFVVQQWRNFIAIFSTRQCHLKAQSLIRRAVMHWLLLKWW